MAIKLGLIGINKLENLLARFLRYFHLLPPAVARVALVQQRDSSLRCGLPVFKTQRFADRARDFKTLVVLSEPLVAADSAADAAERPIPAPTDLQSAEEDGADHDDDLEPYLMRKSGSGPGFARQSTLALYQEASVLPFHAKSSRRLRVIREHGSCVVGTLACGYVLSGLGSVKNRSR